MISSEFNSHPHTKDRMGHFFKNHFSTPCFLQATAIVQCRPKQYPVVSNRSTTYQLFTRQRSIRSTTTTLPQPKYVRSKNIWRASASSTETTPPPPPTTTVVPFIRSAVSQLLSLMFLLIIQRGVEYLLTLYNISFPVPLAAMLITFTILIVCRIIGLSSVVDRTNTLLFYPGVSFLSRWLAVFFVPNLVMLPLAPKLPAADLYKIGAILVGGFFFSLFSSAIFCVFLRYTGRKLTGRKPTTIDTVSASSAPPSNALVRSLAIATTGSLLLASRLPLNSNPAKVYALSATLLSFVVGQRLPRTAKMLLHPLICCTLGSIAAMGLLAFLCGTPFAATLATYYPRGAAFANWGAGNLLAGLLGPAVITFAFTMDKQRRLARARVVEVVGTTLFATLASFFGTAFVARMLSMTHASRLIVLPRMITAPLAVAIAEMLQANIGLAASVVALTGLLGANVAASVLTAFGVRDPVVRGLSVGSAAHGLGTASLSEEGAAFPFAALGMTLVGIFSTVLIAYAPFRVFLLKFALNGVATVAAS